MRKPRSFFLSGFLIRLCTDCNLLFGSITKGAPISGAPFVIIEQLVRVMHQSGGMTAGKKVLDHRIQVMKKVQTALAVWDIQ